MNIRTHRAQGVGTIVLARAPVNALTVEMMQELIASLKAMDADPDVRVVILTGEGRCFSAGVDLKQQLQALESGDGGPISIGADMYDTLLNGRKPTIAAVNGPALGGGLGMAASCCMIVASETAVFGIPEIKVGMLGGARHAMRLLGHSAVNRMLLTGEPLTAQEMLRRGAIEACLPGEDVMPYARDLARQIAERDPVAVQMARATLAEIEGLGVLEGYRREMVAARELGGMPSAQQAMRRFLEGKR